MEKLKDKKPRSLKMIQARTASRKAVDSILDKYDTADEFIDGMEALSRDRTDAVKQAIKDAGGYRKIFLYADRKFDAGGSTTGIVEKWFITNLDSPDLATADPSGYRYTINSRFDSRYGFRYLSDFMAAYNWYMEAAK